MCNYEITIAKLLLQSKAIKLEPTNPFTWASGWHSPIYCDNRRTLSFPEIRTIIREGFVSMIRTCYPDTEVIAGVATGAIAQGALVADALKLPFIYVRSSAKSHGMENMIEGNIEPGKKVVIIEDLVSTGGSSLKAHKALENAGYEIAGMCAIFSYGFKVAEENFQKENCSLHTLTNYDTLIDLALQTGYIKASDVEILTDWRNQPDTWNQS